MNTDENKLAPADMEEELEYLKEAYHPVSHKQKQAMTRFTLGDIVPLIAVGVIGFFMTRATEINIVVEYGVLAAVWLAVTLLSTRDKLRLMSCIEIYSVTAHVMHTSAGAIKVVYYDIKRCEFEERTITFNEKTRHLLPEYQKGGTADLLFGQTEKKMFYISPKPLDF